MDDFEMVAIVGMACGFPGSLGVKGYWETIRNGKAQISHFSNDQLLKAGILPELVFDDNYVKAKGILQNSRLWEPSFFGFSPHRAAITDPQHRVMMINAWNALEDAGYNPYTYNGNIGVFAGQSMNTYWHNVLYNDIPLSSSPESLQAAIGNDKDSLTSEISYCFDLKGPSITVQSSSSTSLTAVHMACQSVLNYECDMALAGGVSIHIPEISGYLYTEGGTMSSTGQCNTFDDSADGFVNGDGAGMVVLKRLSDALEDKDSIYAVIRGSFVSNDGRDKVSYSAPSIDGQAKTIDMAYRVSNVNPESIQYLEAHGTGTLIGDPIELAALNKVFRNYTNKKNYCAIGSVKQNIGHLDAAAGIAGLIKAVLIASNREIPPAVFFNRLNRHISMIDSPFYINRALRKVPDGNRIRVGVSSFGMGGTNVHMVLESVEKGLGHQPAGLLKNIFVLSAKSQKSLREMESALAGNILETEEHGNDIAYTLQTGRAPFEYRTGYIGRTDIHSMDDGLRQTSAGVQRVMQTTTNDMKAAILHSDKPYTVKEVKSLYGIPVLKEMIKRNVNICAPALSDEAAFSHDDGTELSLEMDAVVKISIIQLLDALLAGQAVVTGKGASTNHFIQFAARYTEMDRPIQIVNKEEGKGEWPIRFIPAYMQPGEEHLYPAAAVLKQEKVFCFVSLDFSLDVDTVANKALPIQRSAGEPACEALLQKILSLWLKGYTIHWECLYECKGKKVHLPVYPFDLQEVWYKKQAAVQEAGGTGQGKGLSYFCPTWIRKGLLPNAWQLRTCRTVIFSNDDAFSCAMIDQIRNSGSSIWTVTRNGVLFCLGDGEKKMFECLSDCCFAFLKELKASSGPVRVLYLWSLLSQYSPNDWNGMKTYVKQAYLPFIELLKAMGRESLDANIYCNIVADKAFQLETEAVNPTGGLFGGLSRAVPREYPSYQCKLIDITAGSKPDEGVLQIMAEMDAGSDEPLVMYRGKNRWVQTYLPIEGVGLTGNSKWKKGARFIIVGGLGFIGIHTAKYLSDTYRADIVLIGRTPIVQTQMDGETAGLDQDEKRRAYAYGLIRDMERNGSSVHVLYSDVSEAFPQDAVFDSFANCDGIIYAAGSPGEGVIYRKTWEEIEKVLAPKYDGLINMISFMRRLQPKMLILCSSISAYIPRFGQLDYASANSFIESFSLFCNRDMGIPTTSIAWDTWSGGGMALRSHLHKSLEHVRLQYLDQGIDVREGCEAIEFAASVMQPQIIITKSTLEQLEQKHAGTAVANALENIGKESTAQTDSEDKMDILLDVFRMILGIDDIKPSDNFFSMGGNSLIGLKCIEQIKLRLHIQLPATILYDCPTCQSIYSYIHGSAEQPRQAGIDRGRKRREAMERR